MSRTTQSPARQRRQLSLSTPSEHERVLAVIAYLWIFCVVPLVLRPDSKYVQFHAKQGVVLALTWFALWLVGIVPVLGWVIFFFGSIVLIGVNLYAILKAWQGERWELPYLHRYVDYLNP